ncbi:3508_t:CDS:2, partial [Acaulospora colombiana]
MTIMIRTNENITRLFAKRDTCMDRSPIDFDLSQCAGGCSMQNLRPGFTLHFSRGYTDRKEATRFFQTARPRPPQLKPPIAHFSSALNILEIRRSPLCYRSLGTQLSIITNTDPQTKKTRPVTKLSSLTGTDEPATVALG